MVILQGKSVFGGVAIGKIQFFKRDEIQIKRRHVDDPEAEIRRFRTAKEKALSELQQLYDKALTDVGEANAMIFEAHQLMLEDPDYNDSIKDIIENEKMNAEYAVFMTSEQFAAMFLSMDDDYMRGRAADIKDISERVISILNGSQVSPEAMPEPVIIVAEDLAPSETVQFEKDKLLALVTQKGSSNSHTAILARTMNIPSLVTTNIEIDTAYGGRTAIVDGFTGLIYIDPDEETMEKMKEKKARADEQRALLQEMKGKETVTLSGKHIHLYSNIGGIQDVDAVLENDAEGIGLFRSEFLYLGCDDYPSEEVQFEAYKTVLSRMGGKKVIIRTMAISGAICGIAGFVIVSGASHTISTATAGGRGFTAIIVAWLSKFNTFIMVAVSFGIVFMDQGAVQIATQYGLNENASNVLLGIILFFLIGAEFFINYRVKSAKK